MQELVEMEIAEKEEEHEKVKKKLEKTK